MILGEQLLPFDFCRLPFDLLLRVCRAEYIVPGKLNRLPSRSPYGKLLSGDPTRMGDVARVVTPPS